MLAKRPTLARLIAVLAMACCVIVAAAGTSAGRAPTPDPQAYVKYYVVAAEHQGQPENLTEIANRFLGAGARSAEIYNLNAGRVQADGAGLTDPAKLNPGWRLVLPWDAAGEGVQYGQLAPAPRPTRPAPKPESTGSLSPKPGPSTSSAGPPSGSGTPAGCTTTAGSSRRSNWAQLRMAADGAWDLSRGNGVMVAVLDSGVDGKLPQLSGRVAVGADVTVGNGRGDTDCLGTGTAMAGIIAASAGGDNTPAGIAPDATILPIRMVGDSPRGRAMDAANAIEVAVSAGASVVALGSHVDLGDSTVVASITTALNHDVVVVVGAPTKPVTVPAGGERSATGALLLAGGVGADGQFAEEYQPGTVEVVAPGIDVATLGTGDTGVLSNTGTQYAVAFVAGQAALVRAAYPDLTAVQVEERIRSTADAMQEGKAADRYGAGMINPAAAVARQLDERQVADAQSAEGGGGGTALVVLLGLGLVAAGGVVFATRMRRRASGG
ncbi:S8 family serine peptidase [Micromonospora sp. NPDC048835]|uniref:S8 family serine peptidase n=1 Tax=Micromonospora sp. NPDC048835 TaxID=3155147 RepID=UPI0033FDA50E